MNPLVIFISYSRRDGMDAAVRLAESLRNATPPIAPRIDLEEPRGYPFPRFLDAAIQGCDVVLFLATPASVASSWCMREVSRAQRIGKRILTVLLHSEAELPFELEELPPPLDFTTSWSSGWNDLQGELGLINSLEARLKALRTELSALDGDAALILNASRREKRRAELVEQIAEFERLQRDPEGALRDQVESVRSGQERQRNAASTVPVGSAVRSVNEPPTLIQSEFRDRVDQLELLRRRLSEPVTRLVAIVGPGGIGKTAMMSRLLEEARKAPHHWCVRGLDYMAASGFRPLRPAVILDNLRKLVPDPAARAQLTELLSDPALPLAEKLDAVVGALEGVTLVVIDDTEALLDAHGQLRDSDLDEFVRSVLQRPDHNVKLIVLGREVPEHLLQEYHENVGLLNLDRGLPAEDAHAFLRELDSNDVAGLKSAPEELLERVRQVTGGHPRALETLYGILSNDRQTSLQRLLAELEQLPAEDGIPEFLIGRLIGLLEDDDRRIVQILAAYRRPVPPSAVDHMLEWYLPGRRSEPALQRLANARIIRRVGDLYYIPPAPDGEWLLMGLPEGSAADLDLPNPVPTQISLLHRAADYFKGTRKRRVQGIDDLSSELAEIELRMRAGEYYPALECIDAIDSEYLSQWGYRDLVIPWREQLIGKLNNSYQEMVNLSWLATASLQQDKHEPAIDHLNAALSIARDSADALNQIRMQVNLGSAHYDDGDVSRATHYYQDALNGAQRARKPLQEAKAREGLCLCLAETGQFEAALRQCEAAFTALNFVRRSDNRRLRSEGRRLEAELRLDGSWIHRLMGEEERAREWLRSGRDIASDVDPHRLEGQFLEGEAEVQISTGRWRDAVRAAGDAVAIGVRTRDLQLCREAGRTLALAHLGNGDVEAACAAADAAARYRRSRRALGAFTVQGMTAFRTGQRDKARLAFYDARVRAEELLDSEQRNFQLLETLGLTSCGLALCGDEAQFRKAVGWYGKARAVTTSRGVVQRSLVLLDELSAGRESVVANIRRVAAGDL